MVIVSCDECGRERVGILGSDWIDLVDPIAGTLTFCTWGCVQSFARIEAGKTPTP